MDYREYLQSEHWKKFRTRVLIIRNRCEICNLGNSWSRFFYGQSLNVHHLTYETLGHEKDTDVAVLCVACHAREHGLAGPALFTRPLTEWQQFIGQFAFPCDGQPYRDLLLMQAWSLAGGRR